MVADLNRLSSSGILATTNARLGSPYRSRQQRARGGSEVVRKDGRYQVDHS